MNEHISNHPLITHKLAILRDINTGTKEFREVVTEISMFLCYEATADVKLEEIIVETPFQKIHTYTLNEDNYVILPILRAGMGMLKGVIDVIPNAKVGHIGISRNEETLEPNVYYYNVPDSIEDKEVFLIDPMLATGGTLSSTIDNLKNDGVSKIKLLCIVASPEGIDYIEKNHPEVKIFCAAVDDKLNDKGYILPGLGDAGDRLYGH